jgi:ubiquitin-like domain-containing CTD phosphatase 1
VHIINPPRISSDNKCKPLLVLDLDHTLLDFSVRTLQENGHSAHSVGSANDTVANNLKRPYMDEFLTWCYKYYDLVVWSQTSWRWLEIKLTELGMISHPGYKICFVLDKTSMFKIVSSQRSGKKVEHSVKPLQIIWSKFPHWSSQNTGECTAVLCIIVPKCTAF